MDKRIATLAEAVAGIEDGATVMKPLNSLPRPQRGQRQVRPAV